MFSWSVPWEVEPQLLCRVKACLDCICSATCCKCEIILPVAEPQTDFNSKQISKGMVAVLLALF